jgi:uncharacterized protein (DUF433 family)
MSTEVTQFRRPRGRPRGTGKIPPSEYPTILARLAAGETQRAVARDYGVVKSAIWALKRRCQLEQQAAEQTTQNAA